MVSKMSTPEPKSPCHFWASAYAVKLIRESSGDSGWQPKPGQEAWQTLRDEIVALNSRGRFEPPSDPKFSVNGVESYWHLVGQPLPEEDDGVANFPQFRCRLAVLARLLQACRRKLVSRLSNRDGMSLGKLAERIQDPRSRTFFELACTIGAQDIPSAMNTLQNVGQVGVSWSLPGGIRQSDRDRDCGVGSLVQSTRLALKLLAWDNVRQGPNSAAVGQKKRVEVEALSGLRFRLSPSGGKAIVLGGNHGLLFDLLLKAYRMKSADHDGWVTYGVILKCIWPNKVADPGENKPRGKNRPHRTNGSVEKSVSGVAPEALKTLKSELDRLIREVMGHPGGCGRKFWIETKKGESYRLDQTHVVWWQEADAESRADREDRGRPR